MHSEVQVKFSEAQQFRIGSAQHTPMDEQACRHWLDEQYQQFDCEPLNPVGKLLSADKVLNVARAAGPSLFSDAQWAGQFAQAALATLRRPVVRIDVESMTVAY